MLRIIAKKAPSIAKYRDGFIKSLMGILDEIVRKKRERLNDAK